MLPNPSHAAYCGGVSSGKTNALLCTLGHSHAWKPFKHIYLMSPHNELLCGCRHRSGAQARGSSVVLSIDSVTNGT